MNGRLLNKKLHNQLGFTLLELLVVIAVIGVLASLAVPRLQTQIQRARFVEVVNATSPYKTAVESCLQVQGVLGNCNAATNGIPANAAASNNVASVVVVNGVITATSQNQAGVFTYTLTPAIVAAGAANGVTWVVGGTCQAQGIC
ncbi:Fimbrial protein [Ephemeroptericola cinctiostellae]|uniref:Fimbrial protein n=1 Tax=Ephemeroptericola cinctiostellae TaxID=2268024 RepID=A0A345DDZ8_9BURK|nr:prepilin-type N-terminal cleavage/methylation domain-containing protein [Ephemeroptericola cinctiostellae]AXF86586.1 Fimbrial protein [Ephemeroptericola cinctiostellae]